jgi:predicted amidophosphoribosyltransferase
MRIPGRWREGYVLDYHTRSSEFLGYDEVGHARFDTTRTEIGDLLYRLKYKREGDVLDSIVAIAAKFVRKWGIQIDAIVPVPATRLRRPQPVVEMAKGLGMALDVPTVSELIQNVKNIKELKDVFDYGERIKLLDQAFTVRDDSLRGNSVLLFDDLYRSGATMNASARVMSEKAGCAQIYALAITRTRSAS